MLKRNDLAKQFELVVKQEIINHNREISSTNQTLQDIQKKLQSQEEKSGLDFSFYASNQKILEMEIEYQNEIVQKVLQELTFLKNDFKEASSRNVALYEDVRSVIETALREFLTLKKEVSDIREAETQLEKKIITHALTTSAEFSSLNERCHRNIIRMKEEIMALPSESLQIKQELEEKLNVARVDFAGVMKELSISKRNSFILEKKIENIYTLIERLDKRIAQ